MILSGVANLVIIMLRMRMYMCMQVVGFEIHPYYTCAMCSSYVCTYIFWSKRELGNLVSSCSDICPVAIHISCTVACLTAPHPPPLMSHSTPPSPSHVPQHPTLPLSCPTTPHPPPLMPHNTPPSPSHVPPLTPPSPSH